MKKIAYITSLPTPYRTPLLERISKWPDVELKTFYCSVSAPSRDWELNLGKTSEFSEILSGITINVPFSNIETKINPSIWRKLKDGRFDVLIISGYNNLTMIIATLWSLSHNIPYILNSESQFLNKRKFWKNILKSFLVKPIISKASAYLPTGKFAEEYFIHYGAEPAKIFYFPNSPDVDFFIRESDKWKKNKQELKNKMGIEKEFTILYIGRLIKIKGLFTLLKAFKTVKRNFNNVSLLLAGNGVLKKDLEEFALNNEIKDVCFPGFIQPEDLPKYYACSDIFILPSVKEAWGVVVNEAMASGLPVVLSDKVGARGNLLEEGENGFCFESGNHDVLARILNSMLLNPEGLTKMGKRSREIIKKHDYSYCEENLKNALKVVFSRIKQTTNV
jgi:glycosyltransferase involved in cell wall biosynthesis